MQRDWNGISFLYMQRHSQCFYSNFVMIDNAQKGSKIKLWTQSILNSDCVDVSSCLRAAHCRAKHLNIHNQVRNLHVCFAVWVTKSSKSTISPAYISIYCVLLYSSWCGKRKENTTVRGNLQLVQVSSIMTLHWPTGGRFKESHGIIRPKLPVMWMGYSAAVHHKPAS